VITVDSNEPYTSQVSDICALGVSVV